MNFHIPKPERLAASKMWISIFCLSRDAYMATTSGQSAWAFEYNFRCLKWFFRKLPQNLWSAFFLKFRFLKYGFWSRDWFTYVNHGCKEPLIRYLWMSFTFLCLTIGLVLPTFSQYQVRLEEAVQMCSVKKCFVKEKVLRDTRAMACSFSKAADLL